MYKVIKPFVDLQDDNFSYDIGDMYPRNGLNVFASRINELAGRNNRQGCPLIEEVQEQEYEEEEENRIRPNKKNG